MKILLTGATGFIGSHIAKVLVLHGYTLMCLKRSTSNTHRCNDIYKSVRWINSDFPEWTEIVNQFTPEIVIHAAWEGVTSIDRNNPSIQYHNLIILQKLLLAAKSCRKFIALGSQAEYGNIQNLVNENCRVNPINEYGKNKLYCQHEIKDFCDKNDIDWYWLRIFSIYGEGEGDDWLITNFIKRVLKGEQEIDSTKGEQIYSYLHISDFVRSILLIINHYGDSGIYNLSSKQKISIKELLYKIRDKINPKFKINVGTLPYRPDQSMYMIGDSSAFIKTIGAFEQVSLDDGLNSLIEYIKNNIE